MPRSSAKAVLDADAARPAARHRRLAVIGLGYVGLPSALFFAEAGFEVIGADVKGDAVRAVNEGRSHLPDLGLDDRIRRVVAQRRLEATPDAAEATRRADAVLIMVPTPLNKKHEPDLRPIVSAGRAVAQGLRKGHLIILESTVYPGVTEDVLRPELERSGLKAGRDFGLAYCPERYNPGDSEHTIDRTKRIVGGIDEASTREAAALYSSITKAGVVSVADIRTCEAAKTIENTQRDLNIALMNEFALILEHLHLDVDEVLQAAATKWNFVPFRPGAGVGGHCLPKDPLYLVHPARKAGYVPRIITAGRRINDEMPLHVCKLVRRGLDRVLRPVRGAGVAVLGLSYKENIGDTRLAPSLVLTDRLRRAGAKIVTVDPYVPESEAKSAFHSTQHHASLDSLPTRLDAFVLMVGHAAFLPIHLDRLRTHGGNRPVLVDGRRLVPPQEAQRAGFEYLGVGAGRHN